MLQFLKSFTVPLGTWFGTPLSLHWSWVLMLVFMGWSDPYNALSYAGVFFLVILHEFGHVLMNKHYGFPTTSVVMYPFGGVAAMSELPSHPKGEFFVAAAGPMVNALLVFPLWFWWGLSPYLDTVIAANVCLLIFNLIPAFPMDGGRFFRAALWPWLGYYKATMVAVLVSRFIVGIFAAIALYTHVFVLGLIAIFVWWASNEEKRRVKYFDAVKGLHEHIVAQPSPSIPAMTVEQSDQMLDDISRRIQAALGRR